MNEFTLYLLKSVTWLTGFALVFYLFLKNERYFRINRFFLLTGILVSFFLPFLTIHYYIDLPSGANLAVSKPDIAGIKIPAKEFKITAGIIALCIYLAGAVIVVFRLAVRNRSVMKSIKNSYIIPSEKIKLVRSDEYPGSFSFFSYVFVNPSVSDVETQEIVNHELGHIRQRHWVDLVLSELLCVLQWFNPLSWIYTRFIRQNHEYLADAEALQRSSNPALYRATLLNQIAGTPVFTLANSFNYSLNKKRFKMMKYIISSPYRKMKILFILPVLAVILFAFSKPEYRLSASRAGSEVLLQDKVVKGTVVELNGTPLQGAAVIIRGTTVGTISDSKGSFTLSGIKEDGLLVVTYVGFKSKVVKPVFNTDMVIKLSRDTINAGINLPEAPPPPPPPPPPPQDFNASKLLLVIDGEISMAVLNAIDQSIIQSMNVLDKETAKKKYGDKGKDGAIEITTMKGSKNQQEQKDVYTFVEKLPEFPGGNEALMKFMLANFKYPPEAAKKGITGKVYVTFIVQTDGKIKDIKVEKSVDPLLDAEAIRLVRAMPDWIPGQQGGKPVDVYFKLPVEFKLH